MAARARAAHPALNPEPGLWMQWDHGDGPEIEGNTTSLFCAWLAWSHYRVVLPLLDRTLPSVVVALDRALRRFGCALADPACLLVRWRRRPQECVVAAHIKRCDGTTHR